MTKTAFALFAIAMVLLAFRSLSLRMRPHLDITSIRGEALELIANAGGSRAVCDQANQIFLRFGDMNRFFQDADLTNYPAICALGQVDAIQGKNTPLEGPAYIKIRVGNHLDAYILKIYNTNDKSTHVSSYREVEIVKACIFAHR